MRSANVKIFYFFRTRFVSFPNRECIGELNPANRKIMEWKWNEKSNREIALRFKLTEGAVKQKLHRARKTLEKKLYQRWQFPNKGSPNVP